MRSGLIFLSLAFGLVASGAPEYASPAQTTTMIGVAAESAKNIATTATTQSADPAAGIFWQKGVRMRISEKYGN
ncbi:hypothetical protein BD311DRAFT_763519 [Dichomitus squalens]|uniref:Uncharacterized protein n=1 Tax=Dichomitus squalens TaxID=114155 RepID=A0A4Q9MIA6_9APHY|nr:hypothetical protein BD311DRAFT_763519 [Dichomitus squalens]